MKLSMNTDFTALPRAGAIAPAATAGDTEAFDQVALEHDERHLRRKVLTLAGGTKILVDLPEAVALSHGDHLVLDDGRTVRVEASPEALYQITPRDPVHLAELCWHIGNRHLAAAIEASRILILRDHVIKAMLEGLGATVEEVTAPFQPVRGAYSGHGHDHGHHHGHHHDHGHHGHGEVDAYGRKPGDPHYGHNHA